MPQWFVYVLRSVEKSFLYVGFTSDISRRLMDHNAGFVRSTKAYKPFQLVAYVAVQTTRKAKELEKYFKSGSGKAILKKRILTDQALAGGVAYQTDRASTRSAVGLTDEAPTRSTVGLTDEAPKGA